MENWIAWAEGPVFLFAISFMILGLIRHVVITLWEVVRALARAGDKRMPWGPCLKATLKWLLPLGHLRHRLHYSLTTLVFHIAIIITPLFLAGHIHLIRKGLGIGWPAIPGHLADLLTLVAIIAALAVIVLRLASPITRALSRPQDYALPLIVALPFATGLMTAHPGISPFPYETARFLHVMSGNLVLFLIPITKLSHMVLLPSTQIIAEVGWHWPSNAGSRVAATLGKENEPV